MGKNGDISGFFWALFESKNNATWNLLRRLKLERSCPWLVSGDFNEILYSCENIGGAPRDERRMNAFRDVLEDCELVDVGTWERGNLKETNIRERLDRGYPMICG